MVGGVRPFTKKDIPQVTELSECIFSSPGPARNIASYLTEIFCRHPWLDDAMPSLVFDGPDGTVVGCLGVMPRRMSMDGRPIRAAISHTFMVAPEARTTMAAIQLLQAFLAGPQDLSIAEGN